MGEREAEDTEHVRRLLQALGTAHDAPRPTPPPAPDVHVGLADGRLLAIELTTIHPDAGHGSSSALRAQEQLKAEKAAGRPYSIWVPTTSAEAIKLAVRDKTKKAAGYKTEPGAELWLLLNGSLAKPGAVAATFMFPALLDLTALRTQTHDVLSASRFEAAYLQLGLGRGLYEWKRDSNWQVRIEPQMFDEGRQMLDYLRGTPFLTMVVGR